MEQNKYEIVSDSSNRFTGVQIDLVTNNEEVGDTVMLFNEKFELTQKGTILVFSNKDCCITLQLIK